MVKKSCQSKAIGMGTFLDLKFGPDSAIRHIVFVKPKGLRLARNGSGTQDTAPQLLQVVLDDSFMVYFRAQGNLPGPRPVGPATTSTLPTPIFSYFFSVSVICPGLLVLGPFAFQILPRYPPACSIPNKM